MTPAGHLRLATVNLFSGRSLADGRIDHDRVAAAVAALDADVVAVQEVDHGQPRSGLEDQAAVVARAAGARWHRFVPLVSGMPGSPGWTATPPDLADPPGPLYGIALASRVPVTAWHVLRLDPPRGRWPILIPTRPPRVLWLRDEPRAVLAAELADPHLVVATAHLSFVPGPNVRQLRRARRWLEALAARVAGPGEPPVPVVLLGDLNLPGGLPARLTGWTPLVTGPTFPAPAPRIQLDHVLARFPGAVPAGPGRILELPFGDHRAAVVDLMI